MTRRNVSSLALVVDDTPDGDGPLENPIGRLVIAVEADIRGHDLRALKARHQSGRLITQLRGTAPRLPMRLRKALVDELGISAQEINHRMRLAEKYQVDDLPNALGKFTSWHDICRHGLYDKRPTPIKQAKAKAKPVTVAGAARDCLIKVRAANTLTAADKRALRALAEAITLLLNPPTHPTATEGPSS
jgi:alpha-beta hydrolase superfamily lysophospholipase